MKDRQPNSDRPGVVLVEGESDRLAVETLASRRGRDLAAERVRVVSMNGIGNIAMFLRRYGSAGRQAVRLAGLYDGNEEPEVRRGLEMAGFGVGFTRLQIEALGFFACEADLEDELIRAAGVALVEQVVTANGELGRLRTFRRQPAWRDRAPEDQLRRFIGTHSGRKAEMAVGLTEAIELDRVPRPLERLLRSI
ncbi:MAG TPA: TOPRIM nucleotidyl transferase/hydrolase domain-containing protein [Actinomycetota bacterium]